MKTFQYSTAGVRSNNEDGSFVNDDGVMCVADGMGGHDHGELASAALVDEWTETRPTVSGFDAASNLMQLKCQEWVAAVAGRNAGSTFTGAAVIGEQRVRLLHCGDTALFHFQRRADSSYLPFRMTSEQNRWGVLNKLGYQTSHGKSELLSCVMSGNYDPPTWEQIDFDVAEGDFIVLASDGFIGGYEDGFGVLRIAFMVDEIINRWGNSDELINLVDSAAEYSCDNATLVIYKVGA